MSLAPPRLLLGLIPWYSFLIVLGTVLAIVLAVKEEKRAGFEKDTILDFVLIVLPCGILGARLYYVAFSWDLFRDDLISILKIWEGGIAIYGAVIAGLLVAWLFTQKRKISFFKLCDLIAPGLILAQSIGRWGNYFNQEAYGAIIQNPALQFFPFGVQIQSDTGLQWHMATFFYESFWDMMVFIFLIIARRKWFRIHGDVICFYALLYACGRLVIEDFRMDSLYASNVRISQLLSVIICALVLIRYICLFRGKTSFRSVPVRTACVISFAADTVTLLWLMNILPVTVPTLLLRFMLLSLCGILNILSLFILYGKCAQGDLIYANQPV